MLHYILIKGSNTFHNSVRHLAIQAVLPLHFWSGHWKWWSTKSMLRSCCRTEVGEPRNIKRCPPGRHPEKWHLLWGIQVVWWHQMSLLVLKSQTSKFKPISASGKGWYNLGVRVYSLHISPSSSPSAQSWVKSHACPSLITVPFQQLKEPSRAIFEREADPREKGKNQQNHFRWPNCFPFKQQVIASCITLEDWTPCEIFSIQSLLDIFFFFYLFHLVECLMVHLTVNFTCSGLSGAMIWKAALTSGGLESCSLLWYFSRTTQDTIGV